MGAALALVVSTQAHAGIDVLIGTPKANAQTAVADAAVQDQFAACIKAATASERQPQNSEENNVYKSKFEASVGTVSCRMEYQYADSDRRQLVQIIKHSRGGRDFSSMAAGRLPDGQIYLDLHEVYDNGGPNMHVNAMYGTAEDANYYSDDTDRQKGFFSRIQHAFDVSSRTITTKKPISPPRPSDGVVKPQPFRIR